MKYSEFVESDRFAEYVGDIEVWEALPEAKRAEVAATGANILGIRLE